MVASQPLKKRTFAHLGLGKST